jgi:hypothetical protein
MRVARVQHWGGWANVEGEQPLLTPVHDPRQSGTIVHTTVPSAANKRLSHDNGRAQTGGMGIGRKPKT